MKIGNMSRTDEIMGSRSEDTSIRDEKELQEKGNPCTYVYTLLADTIHVRVYTFSRHHGIQNKGNSCSFVYILFADTIRVRVNNFIRHYQYAALASPYSFAAKRSAKLLTKYICVSPESFNSIWTTLAPSVKSHQKCAFKIHLSNECDHLKPAESQKVVNSV